MTRMQFGGGPEDVYLIPDSDGDLQAGGGAGVLFYSTETGSTAVTDLLDASLSPITTVVTSNGSDGRSPGQIKPFYGPDGVFELWASANGSPRFLMQASNLGSYVGPVKVDFTAHAAAANGHGTRLQDLVNVNTASIDAATNGQTIAYNSGSGLFVAATPAVGDMTLAGTQTVTGAKTHSSLLTLNAGELVKPASAAAVASTVQAAASQTANLVEWRDSANALKAYLDAAYRLVAPNTGRTVILWRAGTLTAAAGTMRWYNDLGVTLTIRSVRVNLGVASTSGTPTIDVNISGTTIYGTQANRPTLAVGSFTSGKNTGFTVSTINDGQYFSVDIDVNGTTSADLMVQIEVV